jgi:anti-sigma regulatory factor (Ser/Thr protein kinase)
MLVDEDSSASPPLLACKAALAAAGWRTTRVTEGDLALTLLRRSPPDLVVVGKDCSGFTRAVKLDHATNLVPVVQIGEGSTSAGVEVEPDAWLPPAQARRPGRVVATALAARAERLRDGTRAEVCVRLPSDPERLDELEALVGPWILASGLSAYRVQKINLALREMVANAIEWGHGNDPDRPVYVECRLDGEKVGVLVRDTGPGFDPGDVPHAARVGDPVTHLAIRAARNLRDGGFGILVTRGLVDLLCYNDAGNEVQLLEYLPPRVRAVALTGSGG